MGGNIMDRTKEEKNLLAKLASGVLDGLAGDGLTTNGGSTVWTAIKNGKPARYKQGPGGKFFNGKENERISGVLHVLKEWVTDDEKLEFIQKFGFLMKDIDARTYSSKFKSQK